MEISLEYFSYFSKKKHVVGTPYEYPQHVLQRTEENYPRIIKYQIFLLKRFSVSVSP